MTEARKNLPSASLISTDKSSFVEELGMPLQTYTNDYEEEVTDTNDTDLLLGRKQSDKEEEDCPASGDESELEPKLNSVFCDADTCSFLTTILKIAVPASLSALLGQVTYMINFIVVG